MQIIFLGTSAGKPTKNRNVSALSLKFKNRKDWMLFDCGEATQHQILKTNLSLAKLKNIFITHLHGDHIYGIFGLLASRSMIEECSKLTIFGPKNIKELIDSVLKYTQLNLSFELDIIEVENNKLYKFDNFSIYTLLLSHSIPTFSYTIIEKDHVGKLNVEKLLQDGIKPGPIYKEIKNRSKVYYEGKVIESKDYLEKPKKGRVVIIAGDNDNPFLFDEIKRRFKYIDLLIHEATYTQDVYDSLGVKIKHSTAKNVAIAAENLNIKNLILTHFSPRYTESHDKQKHNIKEILEEAKKYYKNRLFLANDFDIYELTIDKNLILKNINQ
ncbi:ribonuclease Z [Nitrosophilus kaiyonis]|uniref:ribonuclease Z n=1 Tax=Nitrosophilus kaiyonis TaxID=2930200 RepID=UPI00249366F4|nr:ribonuclease Z [Nitrosophilus kaiyonis]